MTKEEKYQYIEDFLNGNLKLEDEQAFYVRMKKDHAFKQEVNLHKSLAQSLGNPAKHVLQDVLNEVDENWKADTSSEAVVKSIESSKAKFNWIKPVMGFAAGIVLFLVAAQFIKGKTSKEDLFASNYTPYRMILTERNGEADNQQLLKNTASEAYRKGNFDEAQKIFNQLYRENPEEMVYAFYEANAMLSNQNNKEAIAAFDKILSKPNHLFKEQSQWFLGLAYLADENYEKAKLTFEDIKEGAFRYTEAQEILGSL